jgi:GNAT superfamily N-acetyltransferase
MNQGYHLAYIQHDGLPKAVAGFRVMQNLWLGKFLYVDDLVTDERQRSLGFGRELFQWLVAFGKQQECVQMELDSGVQRHDAHRFYLRERMYISGHHFSLKL